jgi:predicted dehydrogenase
MKRLKIAGIGCGSRTSTYMKLAAEMPERYEIVGAADLIDWKVARIARLSDRNNFRSFTNARQLLAADRFADILIIGTQDSYHVEPCIAALEKGYDVLLEKPIATSVVDLLKLESVAKRLGRRVLICHVLRYTPFYQKVKQIVAGGQLGDIVTMQASEGVGTFHQAHSFVRGHWSITESSSPMIIQKSCHDLDIIQWMMDRPFTAVSSFGQLSYFNLQHKPADAPKRCIDACPVGATCQYNAIRYLTDQRGWLPYVYNGGENASDDDVRAWLKTSPWGRCVYQCDNTAVDHQVVTINFTGGATATFTMSAFDSGRNLEIWGTEGVLRGGTYTKQIADCDIVVRDHATNDVSRFNVEPRAGAHAGHGGGDRGLMESLYTEMQVADSADMRSSLHVSVESHLIGFAAEESRMTAQVVEAKPFRMKHALPASR